MTRETKINKNRLMVLLTLSPFSASFVGTSSSEILLKELISAVRLIQL